MTPTVGVRREDKSPWEARVPLTPDDVRELVDAKGLSVRVQSSSIRAFPDKAYRAAGATVAEDLGDCPVVLGVKEIPVSRLEAGRTYLFFSHTIKRQPANMPMLRRIVELGCTLIDYERIVDEQGRRLVFFGRFAGLAGMIDALWALGRRLEHEGVENPFQAVRRAYEYDGVEHAKREIAKVGEAIRQRGLPREIEPFVCGFAGYGNVSRGAQEVFDLLPVRDVPPAELSGGLGPSGECCKVVFREEHIVERADGGAFGLQDYYDHPGLYRSTFFRSLPHLTMLMNCIYWAPEYPRLVTCEQIADLFGADEAPRLRVIGDVTCDIEGSIECTVRATEPGDPAYVYEPGRGSVRNGLIGDGPVILAVDILPCELPVDASVHFGQSLRPLIPALARANLDGELEQSGLPTELQRAAIVYRGKLTEPYRYLEPEIH